MEEPRHHRALHLFAGQQLDRTNDMHLPAHSIPDRKGPFILYGSGKTPHCPPEKKIPHEMVEQEGSDPKDPHKRKDPCEWYRRPRYGHRCCHWRAHWVAHLWRKHRCFPGRHVHRHMLCRCRKLDRYLRQRRVKGDQQAHCHQKPDPGTPSRSIVPTLKRQQKQQDGNDARGDQCDFDDVAEDTLQHTLRSSGLLINKLLKLRKIVIVDRVALVERGDKGGKRVAIQLFQEGPAFAFKIFLLADDSCIDIGLSLPRARDKPFLRQPRKECQNRRDLPFPFVFQLLAHVRRRDRPVRPPEDHHDLKFRIRQTLYLLPAAHDLPSFYNCRITCTLILQMTNKKSRGGTENINVESQVIRSDNLGKGSTCAAAMTASASRPVSA